MAHPAEKRLHQLTLAIQKAINAIESPVKEKHVRRAIIGTFQEQSAVTYWMLALRQPLQDDRIVAWKFCHVTHKLLREGHAACLDDSQRHVVMIKELGKLWMHLREGYGRLIYLYSNLLATKLTFHSRNPRFPGNMQLTVDELDNIAENDVNNYFQLCVELFDYMDDILSLQAAVFDSLGNARANSMTASGQCRLAALIPCAQDASHIYDCNVRLLFRLHAALPPDVLTGHRERFGHQFKQLNSFYKRASSLQYYRNLLTLPVLPSGPPNFLLQSDFGTYVTPVVTVPQTPDDADAVGALIDTSDTASQPTSPDHLADTPTTPPPAHDPLDVRDKLIEELQNELARIRYAMTQMAHGRNAMMESMDNVSKQMVSKLVLAKQELKEEKMRYEILSHEGPELKKKISQTEERNKVLEEKFQKLKGAYTQLREEHIALIRQKAEVDKLSAGLRAAAAQHESAKAMLQQQLTDKMKDVELLHQNASSSEEVEAYKTELGKLRSELELSRQKEAELESLKASMEALEIEHKTTTTEQEEKLTFMANDLKEATENLDRLSQEAAERDAKLSKTKEELTMMKNDSLERIKNLVEEKHEMLKELLEGKRQHEHEIKEKLNYTNDLQAELKTYQTIEIECNELKEELSLKNKEFEGILNEKDLELREALEKLTLLENKIEIVKNNHEEMFSSKTKEVIDLSTHISELENVIGAKEQSLHELNNACAEKDDKITSLQSDSEKLTRYVADLSEQLQESQASLESSRNEIIRLTQQYEDIQTQYDASVSASNTEIEELKQIIKDTSFLKEELSSEREVLLQNEQDLGNTIEKLRAIEITLSAHLDSTIEEKNAIEKTLKQELEHLTTKYSQLGSDKEDEARSLNEKIQNKEMELRKVVAMKDSVLNESEISISNLKAQMLELEQSKQKEIDELKSALSEKGSEAQLLEARLEHTENERLNVECELQDLLQHNNTLEADIESLKIQLDEVNAVVKKQTSNFVTIAAETALDMTNFAISKLENTNTEETAADRAAKALEELGGKSKIEGNEDFITKCAVSAAHNTCLLSAYVVDLSAITTDIKLADKLKEECRSMLTSTQQCLERVRAGEACGAAGAAAAGAVQRAAASAAAADTPAAAAAAAAVDAELADMDRAIEDAAGQIEAMLAASRAGDKGVKLEVNEKILDACTTLMGAVKVLVQDSRRLQNELGDPGTRQKLYARNPLWSDGLISASKAVVFAAKLLVTSADEAVNSEGRVEGVSVAAHEVAGSTALLVAASRAKARPGSPALGRLTAASRAVTAATAGLVAAARAASALVRDHETLDTSSLSLTATRRLEIECKMRALQLETELDAERARLAALHKRHYQLAQETGNVPNEEV